MLCLPQLLFWSLVGSTSLRTFLVITLAYQWICLFCLLIRSSNMTVCLWIWITCLLVLWWICPGSSFLSSCWSVTDHNTYYSVIFCHQFPFQSLFCGSSLFGLLSIWIDIFPSFICCLVCTFDLLPHLHHLSTASFAPVKCPLLDVCSSWKCLFPSVYSCSKSSFSITVEHLKLETVGEFWYLDMIC